MKITIMLIRRTYVRCQTVSYRLSRSSLEILSDIVHEPLRNRRVHVRPSPYRITGYLRTHIQSTVVEMSAGEKAHLFVVVLVKE